MDELPAFHLRRASLFCPYHLKGTVMRAMAEAGQMPDVDEVEMKDGIKVHRDGGWALVLPHSTEPRVELFAEGPDEASAEALLQAFTELVAETVSGGE